jgi:hypothetical protein
LAKSPRSAADRTATHHRIRALRALINYWAWAEKVPVGAGGLLEGAGGFRGDCDWASA